jgi:hypothetical protein
MRASLVIAALSAAVAMPAFAQSNLQWRTTECQVQDSSGEIVARNRCQAGFAYDTAIRAIKYWDNNRWIYHQVGQNGATFGKDRECIFVSFDDQTTQLFCTVKTPEQLGIRGD